MTLLMLNLRDKKEKINKLSKKKKIRIQEHENKK